MKRKRILTAIASLAFIGTPLCSTSVFAASDPYGIDYGINYSEGVRLENAVTIDNNLNVAQLGYQAGETQVTGSQWKQGWIREGNNCRDSYFIIISSKDTGNLSGVSYSSDNSKANSQEKQDFKIVNQIKRIQLSKAPEENKVFAIAVKKTSDSLYGGVKPYKTEAGCQAEDKDNLYTEGSKGVADPRLNDTRIYVETNISLQKNSQSFSIKSGDLYFGLTDIDAGQAYQIRTNDEKLIKANMIVDGKAVLQDPSQGYYNMYRDAGEYPYIYSTFGAEKGQNLDIEEDTNNIYVPLKTNSQDNGLDMVFGYGVLAASGIRYYARQYTVEYKSDEFGKINGDQPTEKVISGGNPTGREQTPNANYFFTKWTVNKAVKLDDGKTTISAGATITENQIKHVVVEEDGIIFTAHHATNFTVNYKSDDGGEITGITNEKVDPNENPSGTEQSSKDGYTLDYWTADVDVTLKDGTIIKAGDPIKTDQIQQVVVDKDITFTAIHSRKAVPSVITPDTGSASKGIDAAQIVTISLFGVLGCGLAIKYLPRTLRKRVNFDK